MNKKIQVAALFLQDDNQWWLEIESLLIVDPRNLAISKFSKDMQFIITVGIKINAWQWCWYAEIGGRICTVISFSSKIWIGFSLLADRELFHRFGWLPLMINDRRQRGVREREGEAGWIEAPRYLHHQPTFCEFFCVSVLQPYALLLSLLLSFL